MKTENSKVTERAANEANGDKERKRRQEREKEGVNTEERQTFTLLSNNWCFYTRGFLFLPYSNEIPCKAISLGFSFFLFYYSSSSFCPIFFFSFLFDRSLVEIKILVLCSRKNWVVPTKRGKIIGNEWGYIDMKINLFLKSDEIRDDIHLILFINWMWNKL